MRPPRSVLLDVPLGHTTGAPGEVVVQRRILTEGLEAAHALDAPGRIVELPYRWVDDRWKQDPLSWNRQDQDARQSHDAHADGPVVRSDTRNKRNPEPQYQSEDDRLAAESRNWDQQCLVCLGL